MLGCSFSQCSSPINNQEEYPGPFLTGEGRNERRRGVKEEEHMPRVYGLAGNLAKILMS